MTTSFALDASLLCPPFFPVSRGQDLLFGSTFRRCFDDCLFAHLPALLPHLPTDSRPVDPAHLWRLSPHGTLFELVMFASSIASAGIDVAPPGAARLMLFGRNLVELASQPWEEFERLVREQKWRASAIAASRLESTIRMVEPSHPWARDARAFAEARFAALGDADGLLPTALEDGRSPEAARELLTRLIRRYGELLQAWPAIFDAAKRLKERGPPPARSLSPRAR
jgi:hypothetical protein